MNRPKGLDVFIYLRKSRKDIEEEKKATQEGRLFDTLERHRRQLLEIAKKEQHHIVEIFQEVGSGEHIIDRPQVQAMLRQVENGAVDAVLVMDLDRLGRGDMFDMGSIFRALQYSETLIITPNEVIDPYAEGAELLFGVKSIIGREELKNITKRLQRGRHVSAKEGKSITRIPPYGYLRDENLKLYPDPDKAWVIKRIFEMIADGHGRMTVAKELKRLGVDPPEAGSGQWNVATIKNILFNEAYLGHIVWGKVRHIKRNSKYVAKELPEDQWHRRNNAHEPIISQELWNRAHAAYESRRPKVKQSMKLVNPLASLLYCKRCGYALRYVQQRERTHMYRCDTLECRGKIKSAPCYQVEARLLELLGKVVDEFNASTDDMSPEQSSNVIPIKKKSLERKQKELQTLHTQKENLHDLLEQGAYDIPTFMERQSKLSERIKQCQEEIAGIEEEIRQDEEAEQNREQFVPRVRSVLEAYHSTSSVEKKNTLLKSVLHRVLYHRDKKAKRGVFTLELFFRT